MFKVLSEKDYTALQAKSSSFEAIQTAVQSAVVGSDAATMSAQEVVALLTTPPDPQANTNQAEDLAALHAQVTTLQQERATLTARVAELTTVPAEPSAAIAPAQEPAAEAPTLAEFANAHQGNHLAVIAELKAEGLLPS